MSYLIRGIIDGEQIRPPKLFFRMFTLLEFVKEYKLPADLSLVEIQGKWGYDLKDASGRVRGNIGPVPFHIVQKIEGAK